MVLLTEDKLFETLAVLGRIRTIYKTLVAQIDILETMTPLQFNSFRGRLESSSGFQSSQFRKVEAILGRRDSSMSSHFDPASRDFKEINELLNKPSLWDCVLKHLSRRKHDFPKEVLNRDVTIQYELAAYKTDPEASLLLEQLVDIDEGQQEWRYRHVKMVERTIGAKVGTGGSSGAQYLITTLFKPTMPELWSVRSQL
jgi:tryptophan 2,3-dioxygenase